MKTITLKKNQSYYLDNRFFIIKSGKIITKDILETGRVIINETPLGSGEILGNFFKFLLISGFKIPEIDIEIIALENNTILEEFIITEKTLEENIYLQKIIYFLLKKVLLKLLYQLYDTKGYVLAILKLQKKSKRFIPKKHIRYENFNISKSQFYLIYNKLKKENYISEIDNRIYFNNKKIDKYLNLLGEVSR